MNLNEYKWLMTSFMLSAINLKYNKEYCMRDVGYDVCTIVDYNSKEVAISSNYDDVAHWGCVLLNK